MTDADQTTERDTGDQDAAAAGRRQVRALMLDPLDAAGLARPRGVTVDAHRAVLDRLAGRLAYMRPENLETLRDVVMRAAIDAPAPPRWPSEVVILQLAHALQRPPADEPRVISSWLASVEGPRIAAQGCLCEMLRFLRRHGRPPLGTEMRDIQAQAAENARRRELISSRIERGTVSDEDRAWLDGWMRDDARARQLVQDGAARRAAEGGAA